MRLFPEYLGLRFEVDFCETEVSFRETAHLRQFKQLLLRQDRITQVFTKVGHELLAGLRFLGWSTPSGVRRLAVSHLLTRKEQFLHMIPPAQRLFAAPSGTAAAACNVHDDPNCNRRAPMWAVAAPGAGDGRHGGLRDPEFARQCRISRSVNRP
jgi:hypothetical protein